MLFCIDTVMRRPVRRILSMMRFRQLFSIITIFCILGVSGTSLCADTAPARHAPRRWTITVAGPKQVVPDETIQITITGAGDGSSGDVELEGLEVVSVSGGFSTPLKYVAAAVVGGLTATYRCRVTAPAGSACSFSLSSPQVADPETGGDVTAACAGWTCAVRTPAAEPAPDTPGPPDLEWIDALAEAASTLPSVYWEDLSYTYRHTPYQVITGNAFLGQDRTWEEYSLLMYDAGYIIVPFRADGSIIEPPEQHRSRQATGQHMLVVDTATGETSALQDLVMRGDVTGQGALGLSQLVRLSQAVRGQNPLVGLSARAADLNGNGRVDLGDLTGLAAWLRGRYVEPAVL